jgi:hypothetical protein
MTFDLWWKNVRNLPVAAGLSQSQLLLAIRTAAFASNRAISPQLGGLSTENSGQQTLDHTLTLDSLGSFELNMLFGRPFFYPFFVNRADGKLNAETARSALLNLGKSKLLNSGNPPAAGSEFNSTPSQALGVLGVLVSLDISAKSECASKLSSEHMRAIAAISMNREAVYTMETAEPLLALAARSLVNDGVIKWKVMIDALVAERTTDSMTGFRGEAAAQILFSASWLTSIRTLKYTETDFPCIPVKDFLETLCGSLVSECPALRKPSRSDTRRPFNRFLEDADFSAFFPKYGGDRNQHKSQITSILLQLEKQLESGMSEAQIWADLQSQGISKSLMPTRARIFDALDWFITHRTLARILEDFSGGFVRCGSFVKTFSQPTRELLKEYFLRSSAIYCVENQCLVDLIVPVYFPSRGPLSADNMTALLVQVKLHRANVPNAVKSAWLHELNSLGLSDDLPLLGIFIEFGHFAEYLDKPGSVFMRTAVERSTEPVAKKRKTRAGHTASAKPSGVFGIFCKRLRMSHISGDLEDTDRSVQALITSLVDVSSAYDVLPEIRACVPKMYSDLVYANK